VPGLCIAGSLLVQGCVEYEAGAASEAAQTPPQPPPSPPGGLADQPGLPAQAQAPSNPLDKLVGPIALYPDPLVALILPASTVPGDISAARAYLVQFGDMSRLDSQPWDPSVRALAHYPAVIQWLADNPDWTRALGEAFLATPGDVMDAVQRLRGRALASGELVSTAQQQVYSEDGAISILPGPADAMYVPAYDSDLVFSDYSGPFISFGGPYPVGPWLSFWPDWGSRGIWVGGWGEWHGGGTWHHPHFGHKHEPPGMHPWPPPDRPHKPSATTGGAHQGQAYQPHPMTGAPMPPPGFQAGRASGQPGTRGAGSSSGARSAPASGGGSSHAAAAPSAPATSSSTTQDNKSH